MLPERPLQFGSFELACRPVCKHFIKLCANWALSLQISAFLSVLVRGGFGRCADRHKNRCRLRCPRQAPARLPSGASLPAGCLAAPQFFRRPSPRPRLTGEKKKRPIPKKCRGSAVRRPAEKPIGSEKVHLENQIFCRLARARVWACGARTRNACVVGGAVKQSVLPALS